MAIGTFVMRKAFGKLVLFSVLSKNAIILDSRKSRFIRTMTLQGIVVQWVALSHNK